MLLIISLILGAVLGVLFTVILEESFARLWQNSRQAFRHNARKIWGRPATLLPAPYEFTVGRISTELVVVDGTGEHEFKRNNISCHFDTEDLILPDDLAAIRKEIVLKQEKAIQAGQPYYWNGRWYALERFVRSRTPEDEDLVLKLYFRPTDCYSFLATSMSLDKYVLDNDCNLVTVRDKYLKGASNDTVVPYLATSFGISVAIITSDEFLVVAQRSDNVASWKEHFNASVNEALSMGLDRSDTDNPDLFKVATRGAKEELNIDLDTSAIRFLTFGFDSIHYQWVLLGMAKVDLTARQIQERRASGAKDKWENHILHFVPFNVQSVTDFVLSHKPWTPFGLVCVLHTLIHENGRRDVETALA